MWGPLRTWSADTRVVHPRPANAVSDVPSDRAKALELHCAREILYSALEHLLLTRSPASRCWDYNCSWEREAMTWHPTTSKSWEWMTRQLKLSVWGPYAWWQKARYRSQATQIMTITYTCAVASAWRRPTRAPSSRHRLRYRIRWS